MRASKLVLAAIFMVSLVMAGCRPAGNAAIDSRRGLSPQCRLPGVSDATGEFPGRGSEVRLEKSYPEFVYVGQPFDYVIRATNTTDHVLENVVVRDSISPNIEINDANPPLRFIPGDHGEWNLGSLEPGETRTIRVNVTPVDTGTINGCAAVTYNKAVCARIEVMDAQLNVTAEAPQEVLLCDGIPVSYTMANSGNIDICGVSMVPQLPDGLTLRDEDSQRAQVSALLPDQTQSVKLHLWPQRTGTFTIDATAQAQGGISSPARSVTVNVVQPVLQVDAEAISEGFLDRPAQMRITVTNTGTGVALDTMVEAQTTNGASFVAASTGGAMEAGRTRWNIGTLAPGEAVTVEAQFTGRDPGTVTTNISATAYCAVATDQTMQTLRTEFTGVPAVLLEMIDLHDPIEVGNEEVYVITVTNQGTGMERNIRVIAELDQNMEFVSAEGITQAIRTGNLVEFEPLPTLEPDAQAQWRVTVRAINPADARFYTSVTTESLTTPVEKTEATRFIR